MLRGYAMPVEVRSLWGAGAGRTGPDGRYAGDRPIRGGRVGHGHSSGSAPAARPDRGRRAALPGRAAGRGGQGAGPGAGGGGGEPPRGGGGGSEDGRGRAGPGGGPPRRRLRRGPPVGGGRGRTGPDA